MSAETEPTREQTTQGSTYDSMAQRLSSRAALWVGTGWGFAEALLFFVVPDVWLGLVALYAPRRMLITLGAIVAGAMAGAAALYLATLALGGTLSDVIVALPGIDAADLEQARIEVADQGAIAFLNGILAALPVKVYIHAASLDGVGLPQVVLFTVLNRLERLLVFGLVMALAGWLGRPLIARWPRGWLVVYVVAWVIFYAGFLSSRGG
jgi:membrane protein YqaA with SNARE-associated domain